MHTAVLNSAPKQDNTNDEPVYGAAQWGALWLAVSGVVSGQPVCSLRPKHKTHFTKKRKSYVSVD